MKKHFDITGMSCAACSARVEKAVSSLDGVDKCSVNLLTNSMTVETDLDSFAIVAAVEKAGYGATESGADKAEDMAHSSDNSEFVKLRNRLVSSIVFLVALMYVSMGHGMFGFPLPEFLEANPVALGLSQFILSGIVLVINQKFFISGFKALVKKSPNMDTLVSIGSGASYVYSTFVLFLMTANQQIGNTEAVLSGLHDLYFESAAMILTLITVGKMLESYSKGKTTNAINGLMELAPTVATVIRDGKEVVVDISKLAVGDIFLVKPGESVPADGVVTEGVSSVDESSLTGESVPVDKEPGSKVSAATINKYGFLKCRATAVGEDTSLSKIIKLVTEASSGKAPISRIADKVSGIFVPFVMAIAVVTVALWLWAGQSVGYALARGISVLVISCPCALGLATPVAIMVASGVGARNGILFKTAQSLEETGKIKMCLFDKTGTVTKGTPVVTDIVANDGFSEKELLHLAYSLEKKSEHPLAGAVVTYCEERGIECAQAEGFEIRPGNGLCATIDGSFVAGGNLKYVTSFAETDKHTIDAAEKCAFQGKTPLFFVKDKSLAGFVAVADSIKEDSADAIESIEKMGIKTVMLTGDNRHSAETVGKICHVDEIIADVTPIEKEKYVRKYGEEGSVAMVGDGINDAPALTAATVGIAIGAGTDIAIDAADVVVAGSTLSDVKSAIILSRKCLRNIKQNLFWAFIYNIIGIPLAAGVWIPLLGWEMNPMFGAAAMSLSSFCVVSNALRLNFVRLKANDKNILKEEKSKMEKTVKIEGMMCPHCEARVKKILEALDGVVSVSASHETKTAVITLSAPVSDDIIKSTIENEGYTVISI